MNKRNVAEVASLTAALLTGVGSMAKKRFSYPSLRVPREVVLGKGSIRTCLHGLEGKKTVVLTSGSAPVVDAVSTSLLPVQANAVWVKKAPGEPTLQSVVETAALIQGEYPELTLVVGGGAVLDWGRLASAVSEGALDITGETPFAVTHPLKTRFVLVPTTCATGAESGGVAVFARNGRKFPVVSDAFVAERVVLDPGLIASLPEQERDALICDAVSHAVEGYASIVPNRLAKEAAVTGLRLIRSGKQKADDAGSPEEDLLMGAYYAGIAATHCSVGAAHAFAHTAARFDVPHAHGNLLALVPITERLLQAGKIDGLWAGAGFENAGAFIGFVRGCVEAGSRPAVYGRVKRTLADKAEAEEFAEAMRSDVCMRSSPLRLNAADIEQVLIEISGFLGSLGG